jgi:hypothetical protein
MQFLRRVDDFFIPAWRAIILGSYGLSNIGEAAEEVIANQLSEIDRGIFHWTMDALGDDDTLEKFFDAIPGFLTSNLVMANKDDIKVTFSVKLQDTLDKFIRRTLSSNSVIESVKYRRLDIYLKAELSINGPSKLIEALVEVVKGEFGPLSQSIETAYILEHWCNSAIEDVGAVARYLLASILQTVPKRDERWFFLAKDSLGLPEPLLLESMAPGDSSASLAIHLHMTRQILSTDPDDRHWRYLWALCRFDIRNTLPRLQNEFCALWNEIIPNARDKEEPYRGVVESIGHLYLDLHPGTGVVTTISMGFISYLDTRLPSPYPLCEVAAHHPNSPTHYSATSSPAVPTPTRFDDQSGTPPHATHPEFQPTAGGSCTASQVDETDAVTTLPSPAESTSPRARGSPSLFPTIDPAPSAPQITSATDPSIRECLDTVAPDLTAFDSETSHPTHQASLSAVQLTSRIVCPDEPIPALPIEETGETSVPIVVPQPGDFLNTTTCDPPDPYAVSSTRLPSATGNGTCFIRHYSNLLHDQPNPPAYL